MRIIIFGGSGHRETSEIIVAGDCVGIPEKLNVEQAEAAAAMLYSALPSYAWAAFYAKILSLASGASE